jgi:hypothetical protein
MLNTTNEFANQYQGENEKREREGGGLRVDDAFGLQQRRREGFDGAGGLGLVEQPRQLLRVPVAQQPPFFLHF